MWLITPIGFFSIVQKPDDRAEDTLTIRARVADDLVALRESYLPALGPVQTGGGTDYRYRAIAPRHAVAEAMSQLAMSLDYSNFKNEVARQQGYPRAQLYGRVWDTLYSLQQDDG